ncbi:AMP-binding protein [Sphingomonas sp. HDW15A]|uniref:AMP-binding protein n=1 Tax=Sphingomonas sp. HDW15A TaxID=2714942 RepID=UPI0014081746|nr:AMP-binding protein [Sphingomonas sp. HDW15A]QIK96184.1 AMP-binding protein [Sphingomonas sp. HDW15A]
MSQPDPTPYPLDHIASRGAGDDVALAIREERLTYRGLERLTGETAAALLARGLKPGDRVATWMGKTITACVMPLAAARAGLVHVPVNPVLKRAQAAHILADSGAKLLIANAARLESLDAGDGADAELLALEEWSPHSEALPPSGHDPNLLAALLYTSGSTGRPKGVMLSHANLWLGAISVAHYLRLAPDDRTLCLLPLAFDYGQSQLLSTWAAGGQAIGFDYLLPGDVRKAVRRHDVTVLAGVPPLWSQLAALDWLDGSGESLRTLTNSGGHLPETVVRQLRRLFPEARLHLMYGLTEAFRSSSLEPALADTHPDSVGKAIPFAELRIVRGDGTEADAGEEGELVHSGPLVAKGYWNDPERTTARFRDGEVWSGDRFVRGEDGLLRFRGRDDAMIKVSGNRLSPNEVEELALASGAVRDAAAFGINDEVLGQVVALAAVALGEDAEERLRRRFAAEAPAYMMPKKIIWLDALPTGATGKVDRSALKAMFQ